MKNLLTFNLKVKLIALLRNSQIIKIRSFIKHFNILTIFIKASGHLLALINSHTILANKPNILYIMLLISMILFFTTIKRFIISSLRIPLNLVRRLISYLTIISTSIREGNFYLSNLVTICHNHFPLKINSTLFIKTKMNKLIIPFINTVIDPLIKSINLIRHTGLTITKKLELSIKGFKFNLFNIVTICHSKVRNILLAIIHIRYIYNKKSLFIC